MLEIVAKRAALRPSTQVSPQTKDNPLLQQFPVHSDQRNIYTFPSQSHNQEHDVSFDQNFMFDSTENFYLRTNMALLHESLVLLEKFESQNLNVALLKPQKTFNFNPHFVFLIIQFLILYFGVIYYAVSSTK